MNKRQIYYNVLCLQILLDKEYEKYKESSSKEEDNTILQTALIQQLNTRYLKPRIYHVAKSKHWWQEVLPLYDPNRFKKLLRMFPHHFQQLANLIRFHPIFLLQETKPQVCVELQLAVFLCRLDSTRSLFRVYSRFGIEKETVILYIKRVIQVIIAQKKTFVK